MRVSPGCTNCHAIRRAWLIAHNKQVAPAKRRAYLDAVEQRAGRLEWSGRVAVLPGWLDELTALCRGKARKRIFVESMGDIFHPGVPAAEIIKLFAFAARTPNHDFLLLTKRPDAMRDTTARLGLEWPGNLWAGASVESQDQDWRVGALLQAPAQVRFLSCEPLLGPLDLSRFLWFDGSNGGPEHYQEHGWAYDEWSGGFIGQDPARDLDNPRAGLDWVICGTESINGYPGRDPGLGPIRDLRDQCQKAHVPFFLKQAEIDRRLVKMPALDGTVWAQVPKAAQ